MPRVQFTDKNPVNAKVALPLPHLLYRVGEKKKKKKGGMLFYAMLVQMHHAPTRQGAVGGMDVGGVSYECPPNQKPKSAITLQNFSEIIKKQYYVN